MEKDYQSSGAASLCFGQKKIMWDHIHSRTAFVFVQNLARVSSLLLEVCCATKLFLKTPPAFNIWVLVGLFLAAMQVFRGEPSRIEMLTVCIAARAGPSSTRMLSAHLQPHQPSTAGHAGRVALAACCDPGEGGFWALEDFQICHMDLGSCFACQRDLVLQVRAASSVRSLLVPCAPIAPACPGTAPGASQVMSISSFSSLQSTENYPAKEKYRWFLFYCLSEGLAQGAGWKDVWWKQDLPFKIEH